MSGYASQLGAVTVDAPMATIMAPMTAIMPRPAGLLAFADGLFDGTPDGVVKLQAALDAVADKQLFSTMTPMTSRDDLDRIHNAHEETPETLAQRLQRIEEYNRNAALRSDAAAAYEYSRASSLTRVENVAMLAILVVTAGGLAWSFGWWED